MQDIQYYKPIKYDVHQHNTTMQHTLRYRMLTATSKFGSANFTRITGLFPLSKSASDTAVFRLCCLYIHTDGFFRHTLSRTYNMTVTAVKPSISKLFGKFIKCWLARATASEDLLLVVDVTL